MAKKEDGLKKAVKAGGELPDLGIAPADVRAITEGLSRLLADTYTLYLKTHNYH